MSPKLSQSTIDIRAARATASFKPSALTGILRADAEDAQMRASISAVLAGDAIFDKAKK